MAKRVHQQIPIERKVFTASEIVRATGKLKRRVSEIETLINSNLVEDDARIKNAQKNIRDTIRDIFGENSQEALDFHSPSLYWSDGTMLGWNEYHDYAYHYSEGIKRMAILLNGLINNLEEYSLDIIESPEGRANVLFEGLNLNARIASVATDLFRNGHYSEAVFAASKALNNVVQEHSGRFDLDGSNLMTKVFSKNDPILAFNDLSDQSEVDEQQGMMHLFLGVVLGIRNPRGHSFPTDSPDEALDFLGLISLLANRVAKARKIT